MMTHLVPLAAAVVERRGGMLIHGAIIARELGVPCVNGIASALDRLVDGVRPPVLVASDSRFDFSRHDSLPNVEMPIVKAGITTAEERGS